LFTGSTVLAQSNCPCVSGIVTLSQGQATAGLGVCLLNPEGAPVRHDPSQLDGAGRFKLTGLPRGVLEAMLRQVYVLAVHDGTTSCARPLARAHITRNVISDVLQSTSWLLGRAIIELRLAPIALRF
jgi:hypothetical protein